MRVCTSLDAYRYTSHTVTFLVLVSFPCVLDRIISLATTATTLHLLTLIPRRLNYHHNYRHSSQKSRPLYYFCRHFRPVICMDWHTPCIQTFKYRPVAADRLLVMISYRHFIICRYEGGWVHDVCINNACSLKLAPCRYTTGF